MYSRSQEEETLQLLVTSLQVEKENADQALLKLQQEDLHNLQVENETLHLQEQQLQEKLTLVQRLYE